MVRSNTAEATPCVGPVSKHDSHWLIFTMGDADRRVMSTLSANCWVRPPRHHARDGLHGSCQARTGQLAQQLQQQIDSIAAESGAPVFEPHVTLIGGVQKPEAEVMSIAADLAARLQVCIMSWLCPCASCHEFYSLWAPRADLHPSHVPPCAHCAQPYQLQLQDVHFGATFHQCVYIRIQPQPLVMRAGAETRAAYGGDRNATYMPHLSLLYSDIDEDARCV